MNTESQIISNTILQKKNEILYFEQNIKLITNQIKNLKKELFNIFTNTIGLLMMKIEVVILLGYVLIVSYTRILTIIIDNKIYY